MAMPCRQHRMAIASWSGSPATIPMDAPAGLQKICHFPLVLTRQASRQESGDQGVSLGARRGRAEWPQWNRRGLATMWRGEVSALRTCPWPEQRDTSIRIRRRIPRGGHLADPDLWGMAAPDGRQA